MNNKTILLESTENIQVESSVTTSTQEEKLVNMFEVEELEDRYEMAGWFSSDLDCGCCYNDF